MRPILLLLPLLAALPAMAAEKHTLLAVFAHPDDEIAVGPLLAKYAKAGHRVYLFEITLGQKGVTPNTKLSGDELGAAREQELACSVKILGLEPPILLRLQDQSVSTPPVIGQSLVRLRQAIDETKPDVILTWGPEGLTGHPDHRMASNIATEAFQQRALLHHVPRKLYYIASRETPPASPMQRAFRGVSDLFLTTDVDAREGLDAASAARRCHKTQWSAEMMAQMDEMARKTDGGHLFLRLALSDLPRKTAGRETDIFEGLP